MGLKNSVNGLGGARVSFLSFSPSAFSSEFVEVEPNEPKLDVALADPKAKSPADDGFSSVEPLPFPKKICQNKCSIV